MFKKPQPSVNVHTCKNNTEQKQERSKATPRQGPKEIAAVYKWAKEKLNPRVLGEILTSRTHPDTTLDMKYYLLNQHGSQGGKVKS